MRREKTAGAAKRRMAFQYAAGGMPDDRGPSPVRFGGGGICARECPLPAKIDRKKVKKTE